MYNVIQLKSARPSSLNEHFNLSTDFYNNKLELDCSKLFTEAVFADGKKSLEPILEKIKIVKEELSSQLKIQDESSKKKKGETKEVKEFDPKAFWKHMVFKDLEDTIQKVFGFRSVAIYPYVEKYNSKTKEFESKELNCFIWRTVRFPIDGLVTDKGFYDSTHSLNVEIGITLGLLNDFSSEEVLAILLHEFGHGIDPAVMDIKYTQVNILSKYLTDREGKLNDEEKKCLKDSFTPEFVVLALVLLLSGIYTLALKLWNWIKQILIGKEKIQQQKLDRFKKMIKDKGRFTRQAHSEAFADNFPRMYGYGPHLASAFKRFGDDLEKRIVSRYNRETRREEAILSITESALKGVHKTEVHRIHALIREYKVDLEDPNIPAAVKKNLKEDMEEMEKILDKYLNSYSDLRNKINKIIYEELDKLDKLDDRKTKREEKKKSEKEEPDNHEENQNKIDKPLNESIYSERDLLSEYIVTER